MLAVCRHNQILYPCKTKLEAELELIQTQTLPGFGVWLFASFHRPAQVLQIQGRKALVSLRNHKVLGWNLKISATNRNCSLSIERAVPVLNP